MSPTSVPHPLALIAACLCLCIAALASPAMADAPPEPPPPELLNAKPIHQLQLEYWKQQESQGWVPWQEPARVSVLPLALRAQAPSATIHGYHPYWMGDSYLSYDWSLLSVVAFFSLEIDAAGNITNKRGWPWTQLVSLAHQNGVKVIVTATLFSSSALGTLLSDPTARQNAIANIVAEVVSGGADGVNIDFEGVPGANKQDLVAFASEMRQALDAQVTDAYLSIATPAVDWANAFDYDVLAIHCDHLMVMAYNYHWSTAPTTGPVSPLSGWGTYNVSWTVQDYLTWGAPPASILLGVPYYGYDWPTVSGSAGASTTDRGVAVTYSQALPQAEIYGYRWDASSSTPWYRYQDPDWRQAWFEDSASLAAKYDLVALQQLGGAGIWALGYDGSRTELWQALDNAFGSTSTSVEDGAAGQRQVLQGIGPNPFRAATRFRLGADVAAGTVAVYDVSGRLVRKLNQQGVLKREDIVTWDGRDDLGRDAAAGVYFVRLEANANSASMRVVRTK